MTSKPQVQKIAEACPLARRPHLCTICGQPIAIGSRYERLVIISKSETHPQPRVLKLHHPRCPEVLRD